MNGRMGFNEREFDLQLNLELLSAGLNLELKLRRELWDKIEAGNEVSEMDYDISIKRTDKLAKSFDKLKSEYKLLKESK